MSGKAFQDAAPPARTAIQEVTLIEESEGHANDPASLLHRTEAFAAPKGQTPVGSSGRSCN
jgi:hypothetical protein